MMVEHVIPGVDDPTCGIAVAAKQLIARGVGEENEVWVHSDADGRQGKHQGVAGGQATRPHAARMHGPGETEAPLAQEAMGRAD